MNLMDIVDRIRDRKPRMRHVERAWKHILRVQKKTPPSDMLRNADGYAVDISYAISDMRALGNGIGRLLGTASP